MSTETEAKPAAGPSVWRAVAFREGYALDADELQELDLDELYDVRVQIVRGTAAPNSTDDEGRMPGSYHSEDLAAEWSDAETRTEFETLLRRANAMAAGLNAAGVPERDLTPPEEYALLLLGTDPYEVGEPESELGQALEYGDRKMAEALGDCYVRMIRANPASFVAWFETHRNQSEEQEA